MEIWYLVFWINGHKPILAGEYQSRPRCEIAAKHQYKWAEKFYANGKQLHWRCSLTLRI